MAERLDRFLEECFHPARGRPELRQVEQNTRLAATSHGCAVAAFRRFYIDRGHVPGQYAKFLKRAQQLKKRYAESLEEARRTRVTVQYEIEELSNEDAEWILEEAKGFVLQIEAVLAG